MRGTSARICLPAEMWWQIDIPHCVTRTGRALLFSPFRPVAASSLRSRKYSTGAGQAGGLMQHDWAKANVRELNATWQNATG